MVELKPLLLNPNLSLLISAFKIGQQRISEKLPRSRPRTDDRAPKNIEVLSGHATSVQSGDRFDESHEATSTSGQQVWIASDGFVLRFVGTRARRLSVTEDLIRLLEKGGTRRLAPQLEKVPTSELIIASAIRLLDSLVDTLDGGLSSLDKGNVIQHVELFAHVTHHAEERI